MRVNDFLPYLYALVPTVPEPMALMYLRLALAEFCKKTKAFKLTNVRLPLVAGIAEYDVSLPMDGRLYELKDVRYNGAALPHRPPPSLDVMDPIWPIRHGQPYAYHMVGPQRIRVVPIPQATEINAVTFTAIVTTDLNADDLGEDFQPDWIDTVSKAAAAKLMGLGEETWFNPPRAQALKLEAAVEMDRIALEANYDHSFKQGVAGYGGY